MTLLEFLKMARTPEGWFDCAVEFGEYEQKLKAAESDNFDLREEIKALKFEADRITRRDISALRKNNFGFRYSVATMNGHMHAHCTTKGCVSRME